MNNLIDGWTPLEYCQYTIERNKVAYVPAEHLALCHAYIALHDSCEKYKQEVMTEDCLLCNGRGERLYNDGAMYTCTMCGGRGYL